MGIIEKRFVKDGTARYDARIHRRKGTGLKSGAMTRTFKKEADAKAWMNKTESTIDNRGSVSRAADSLTLAVAAADYIAKARPMSKEAKAKAKARAEAGKSKSEPQDSEADGDESNVAEHERQAIATCLLLLGPRRIGGIGD